MVHLKNIDGGKILDIACGGGHTSAELCKELKRWDHVTGVDIRDRLKEEFLKKFPEGKASFISGDVRNILHNGMVFDTIVLGFSLHHLPNVHALIADLADMCTDRGHLIILEMFNDDLTPAQMIQKRVHELAGRLDRMRGEYHAPVLSRETIDASVTSGGKWTIVHTEDDYRENFSNDQYKIGQTGKKLQQIAASAYKNSIPEAVQEEINQLMDNARRIGMSSPPFRLVIAKRVMSGEL